MPSSGGDDRHPTDRVVVVSAGFGVWQGSRHVASARWSDVVRVRAFTRDEATTGRVYVTLALRGGGEVSVYEALPGYQSFLAAAEAALPGMRPRAEWLTSVQEPAGSTDETVLFERSPT